MCLWQQWRKTWDFKFYQKGQEIPEHFAGTSGHQKATVERLAGCTSWWLFEDYHGVGNHGDEDNLGSYDDDCHDCHDDPGDDCGNDDEDKERPR